MKKRTQLILAVLLLILLFTWHRSKQENVPDAIFSGSTNAIGSKSEPLGRLEVENPPRYPGSLSNPTSNQENQPTPSKEEELQRGLSGLNHVDIVFYGKVEDQTGEALPHTPVLFRIMYRSGFKAGIQTNATITDAQGYFTISGYKGESLSIIPQKEGYVLASTNGGGIYSHMWPEEQRVSKPDPANPVVIKMWKPQVAEELVDIARTYRIPFENSSFRIDLIEGKIVDEGGDLRFDVFRRKPFDGEPKLPWRVRITAVDGGLQEVGAQAFHMTFEAPTEGYEIEFTREMQLGAIEGFTTGFFIKSRNGRVHSKAFLTFWTDPNIEGPTRISLFGLANGNGSRNWEVDPKKVKKPQSVSN